MVVQGTVPMEGIERKLGSLRQRCKGVSSLHDGCGRVLGRQRMTQITCLRTSFRTGMIGSGGRPRHVCDVTSANARELGLQPVRKQQEADSTAADYVELSDSGGKSSFEDEGGVSGSVEAMPRWSRSTSILWTIQEARVIISKYSKIRQMVNQNRPTMGSAAAIATGLDEPSDGGEGIFATSVEVSMGDNAALEINASMPEAAATGAGMEFPEEADSKDASNKHAGLLALAICGLCYLHCSATGFALPALLPQITHDIPLSDTQGALLTTGYTLLYAAALIPMGILADRVDRPKLLAVGAMFWSVLNSMVARAGSFGDLILLRFGFAAAQATQNPICMSMLPELFPKNKSTAMAVYNCAIYMGRALSFAFVMLLAGLGVSDVVGVTMVPLDSPDLDMMSVLYTTGDSAAVLPVYDYNMNVMFSQLENAGWRDLLFWAGTPGIAIAFILLFFIKDPRSRGMWNRRAKVLTSRMLGKRRNGTVHAQVMDDASFVANSEGKVSQSSKEGSPSVFDDIGQLVKLPSFQATTFAAAMNDVGGWGLIAWQAIFYERVFDMPAEEYAPVLAAVIPLGGILGGVGGGLAADWLSKTGNRFVLTFGASLLSAPLIYWSLQSDTPSDSFFYLLFGFALSECWRAPAAVMVREIAPESMGSTASAVHLCVRNVLAGLGPLGVAALSQSFGLQDAMTLIPCSYALSAVGFLVAEVLIKLGKQAHDKDE